MIPPPLPNKAGRYYANLSVYYYWALHVEAWLKGRSLSEEAGSLLSAKLMEREPTRDRMLTKISARLGITKDELEEAIYSETIAPDLTIKELTPHDLTINDLVAENEKPTI